MGRILLILAGAAIAAFWCALGRYFGRGRGAKWVNTTGDPSGVNMPETLKFLSKLMYALAAVTGGGCILAGITGVTGIIYAGLISALLLCVAALVYMNVSGRFRL